MSAAEMKLDHIVVACTRRPVWRKGVWAVHESFSTAKSWTVTHVPSGRRAACFDKQQDAISCAEDMFRHAPKYGARAAFGSEFKGRAGKTLGAIVSAHYDGAP